MRLENFRPQSKLVTKTTLVERPRFPVVDAHNHLSMFGDRQPRRSLTELLDLLDQAEAGVFVDLDGGWGEALLQEHLDWLQPAAERFLLFGGVEWEQWKEKEERFPEWAAARLKVQQSWGAAGLKIWKVLGLHVRDAQDVLVPVDDPRLDPIWQAAGELDLPVLIHVADPVAFFDPLDETNERWEELQEHPDWYFPSPPFPAFLTIVEGLANLVARHPGTTFIGAHVGCYAENLAWVGSLLERCPNFYVDIGARLGELGRQPYTARRFFLQYADRILFGTDTGPDLISYRKAYRFLETDDEYFNYSPGDLPGQGRWHVHGLYLPEDVLEKIYYQNAQRILLKGADFPGTRFQGRRSPAGDAPREEK
jgi:predicted TIM-barrel fold metal-dependent hydrolase